MVRFTIKNLQLIKLIYILSILLFSNCTIAQKRIETSNNLVKFNLKDSLLINLIDSKILEYPNNTQFAIALIKKGVPYYYGVKKKNEQAVTLNNNNMAFEIGSMTKVFTTQLLAQDIIKGKLELDTTLEELTDIPLNSSNSISLKGLASHSSGLPTMPKSFFDSDFDEENPYKDFGKQKLLEYLRNEILIDTSKANSFSYSNIGISILGYFLSKTNNKSYKDLLQENILKPLKMKNTTLNRNEIQESLVEGIKLSGINGKNWDLGVIEPAGGLYSTTEDLVKYILNCLDTNNDIFTLQSKQVLERNKALGQGLGWMIINSKSGKKFFFHAGATGVYSSIFVIDREEQNAVILLSNIETSKNSVDLFGFKLMKELGKLN